MKRAIAIAALAIVAAGPATATSADAFFIRAANAKAADSGASTLGRPASQLRFGSKAWFEQMEREGRFGGSRRG